MNKHTPGPWKWKVNTWHYALVIPPSQELTICSTVKRIAVLEWEGLQKNPYTIPNDEAQANAWLIAASPELLEAAKAAAFVLDGEALDKRANAAGQTLGELLEAAIAKAEGRES